MRSVEVLGGGGGGNDNNSLSKLGTKVITMGPFAKVSPAIRIFAGCAEWLSLRSVYILALERPPPRQNPEVSVPE